MISSNRYAGRCHACRKQVAEFAGHVESTGGYYNGKRQKFILWCKDCYNKSDNSGDEDRCCGNRAYEDACARACGMDNYGGGW